MDGGDGSKVSGDEKITDVGAAIHGDGLGFTRCSNTEHEPK